MKKLLFFAALITAGLVSVSCSAKKQQMTDKDLYHLKGDVKRLTIIEFDAKENADGQLEKVRMRDSMVIDFNEEGRIYHIFELGPFSQNYVTYELLDGREKSDLYMDDELLAQIEYIHNAWGAYETVITKGAKDDMHDGKEEYSYNKNRQLIEKKIYKNGALNVRSADYEYDKDDHVLQYTEYDGDGQVLRKHAYTYNEKGFMASETTVVAQKDRTITWNYSYEYDDKGNYTVQRVTSDYFSPTIYERKIEYYK